MTENELTDAIIGAAIVVHRRLGPGLLESVYRRCLAHELRKCGFSGVELKAKSVIHPIDKAQTLSHLRLMNPNVGLLLSFHEAKLVDGLHRIANNYSGPEFPNSGRA
jgi:hypothetical protein